MSKEAKKIDQMLFGPPLLLGAIMYGAIIVNPKL